ncbi:MAG TPA: nitroreductase [Devosia sp.]|nr:nitroreductase [Devosia sp.]
MAANPELLKYLQTRRSVPLAFLEEPGPTREELDTLLEIGLRVPDHAKLNPWRLIIIEGEARRAVGEKLAGIVRGRNPELSEEKLEVERNWFLPAPLTIGVISSPVSHPKVVEIEQLLSAGAVALNLVHGANALGYAAHWVTRWFAHDAEAAAMLGAREGEQFVAFVHVGTPQTRLEDKPKPDMDKLVSYWRG